MCNENPVSNQCGVSMQRAVYVIKPEALLHRDEIRNLIGRSGLVILDSRVMTFGPNAIDVLSPDVAGDLRAATVHYYTVGPSEIGVVQGDDAIRTLGRVCGEAVAPTACGPETIRARFGIREPVQFGEAVYYRNGFHRSRNPAEATAELRLVSELIGAQFSLGEAT